MDRFKPPSMDWNGPGDLHKRFKVFKQKCKLIFEGPLAEESESKKARLLLLWLGDKGLEIYNTAMWTNEDDHLKLVPIFEKFEAYTKPQSNHILSRYQLRCLKQGDMSLEEFLTKARVLVDDSGYHPSFKEETLRDTMVFGLKSDGVRKEAIAKGNSLTFQQVYELAKTEESTRAQMQVITQGQGELGTALCSVRSKANKYQSRSLSSKQASRSSVSQASGTTKPKIKFKCKGCFKCGNNHGRNATCPAAHARCNHCNKIGHFQRVCMKKRLKQVNEIMHSPDYQGQDIHLIDSEEESQTSESATDASGSEDSNSEPETITVVLGCIASENAIDSVSNYPNLSLKHYFDHG